MKIQPIQSTISFCSRIIDAHAHVGFHDNQILTKNDLDVFVKSKLPNKDTVEKILVSDIDVLHGVKSEYQGNTETKKLFENDTHYELFASCNPKNGNVENIKKLYREHSFIGLKFHPQIQELELSSSKYTPYLEFANEHKIPCLFHSEVKLTDKGLLAKSINKYSDPQIIYDTAKKYKNTPFVMAHMGAGWNEAHDKAIEVLVKSIKNGDANLYADISWVDIDAGNKDHIVKAIKELKGIGKSNWKYGDQSFRLMFGTDSPLARFKPDTNPNAIKCYNNFIEEIKTAIKNDKDLAKDSEKIINDLFYNNAKKLYLDNTFSLSQLKQKNKKGFIVPSIITALGTVGYILMQANSRLDTTSTILK